MRLRCLSEITGPQSVPGSCGSPGSDALVDPLEDLDALVVPGPRQQHPRRGWRSPGPRACTARCRSCSASAKSASSSTMVADLPPSSRKRRFIVAAPFSMIRLPTDRRPGEGDQVDLRRERELLADEMV